MQIKDLHNYDYCVTGNIVPKASNGAAVGILRRLGCGLAHG